MKKIKKIFLFSVCSLFLYSCGSGDVGKVLRNEKIRNSDEFLVKKRESLSLPPDYKSIPEPGSLSKNEKQDNKIEDILKISKEQSPINNEASSIEQSIINQIGK